MKSGHEIIQAVEAITSGLKITTPQGTYAVVGVSRCDRLILAEAGDGQIFKIYPMEIIATKTTGETEK